MKVKCLIDEYVRFKKSLGMSYENEYKILCSFCRQIKVTNVVNIKPESVRSFIGISDPKKKNKIKKFLVIRGFYNYLIGRDYVRFSPLPDKFEVPPSNFTAYIYSPTEFRRMLRAIDKMEISRYQFTPFTFKVLLILMFNTGIRIGEALSLRLRDVDFGENLLTIISSKNNKSRLVPISSKLSKTLKKFANHHRNFSLKHNNDATFFVKRNGLPCSVWNAEDRFRSLCTLLDIRRTDGKPYNPRLHDIRHTFSVARLLEGYKRGEDIQQLLAYLSTYLGHTSFSSTQIYISMIPELLNEANKKFEHYVFLEG